MKIQISRWNRPVSILCALAALGLVACGSDSSSSTPPADDAGADDTADDDTADDDDSASDDDTADDDDSADDDTADDDTADDDTADDDTADDDTADDDTVDDDTADDDTADDDTADDDTVDDDTADDDTADDDTADDDTVDDDTADDDTADDTADDDTADDVPSGDLDDLIGAICDWEFRCCERGELDYRLGPFTADAEDCRDRFVTELRESNSTENDFPAGSSAGPGSLLGSLAFQVNLAWVEVNEEAVAACIEQWEQRDCNTEPELTSCDGPGDPVENPCALTNLFNPVQGQDDRCTLGLAEGAENDVECVSGSTCLPSSDAENPNAFDACVQRGVEGQPCTNDDDCDFNFYCDNSTGDCTEKGDEGDPCSFNDSDEPQPGDLDASCKGSLSCHPIDEVCVSFCTTGYTCTDDSQCPDGQSCAPLTVNNDSTSFHECRPLGDSTQDRCDDDNDCVPGDFCNSSGVCGNDTDEDEPCAVDGECPAGTYCHNTDLVCTVFDLPGTGDCTRSLSSRLDTEYDSEECGPNGVCVWEPDDGVLQCRTASSARNANGDDCLDDFDCASRLCEDVEDDAASTPRVCTSGADEGDDCDSLLDDGAALRCGPGLSCIDGECVAQVGPGGDCEDNGDGNGLLCTNMSCANQWNNNFACTDAPVAVSNGGTNVTCDGGE